eukprot:scaffold126_cov315-Pavlova_lutheri.AAC.40
MTRGSSTEDSGAWERSKTTRWRTSSRAIRRAAIGTHEASGDGLSVGDPQATRVQPGATTLALKHAFPVVVGGAAGTTDHPVIQAGLEPPSRSHCHARSTQHHGRTVAQHGRHAGAIGDVAQPVHLLHLPRLENGIDGRKGGLRSTLQIPECPGGWHGDHFRRWLRGGGTPPAPGSGLQTRGHIHHMGTASHADCIAPGMRRERVALVHFDEVFRVQEHLATFLEILTLQTFRSLRAMPSNIGRLVLQKDLMVHEKNGIYRVSATAWRIGRFLFRGCRVRCSVVLGKDEVSGFALLAHQTSVRAAPRGVCLNIFVILPLGSHQAHVAPCISPPCIRPPSSAHDPKVRCPRCASGPSPAGPVWKWVLPSYLSKLPPPLAVHVRRVQGPICTTGSCPERSWSCLVCPWMASSRFVPGVSPRQGGSPGPAIEKWLERVRLDPALNRCWFSRS